MKNRLAKYRHPTAPVAHVKNRLAKYRHPTAPVTNVKNRLAKYRHPTAPVTHVKNRLAKYRQPIFEIDILFSTEFLFGVVFGNVEGLAPRGRGFEHGLVEDLFADGPEASGAEFLFHGAVDDYV